MSIQVFEQHIQQALSLIELLISCHLYLLVGSCWNIFPLSLHWYQYAVVTATTTDTVVRTPVMHMNSALSGVVNNARNREKYREIELLSILCVYVLVLSCCCCCVCEIVPLYA